MFEEEIHSVGLRFSFRQLLVCCLGLSSLLIAGCFLFLPSSPLLLLALLFCFYPPLLLYFVLDFMKARKQRLISQQLPSALFQMASMPQGTPIEKMISSASLHSPQPLKKELEVTGKQIKAGASVAAALDSLKKRNSAALLSKTVSLLKTAYSSGADFSLALRNAAEDAFQLESLQNESAASMSLQKYTLLAAGAFLVPAILGSLLSVVSSLNEGFSGLLGSTSIESRKALVDAVVNGNYFYLSVFALISAYFIAATENNPKKAVLYAAFTLPLALLVFSVSRGLTLF